MCYTNIIAIMKWWYPHTNKLKYCSYAKFDEQTNKFGKVWSPGFELTTGTSVFTLITLKIIYQTTPSSKIIYLNLT